MILWIIALVVMIYFFFVFVVLRLIVPFLGFGKLTFPNELPDEVRSKIKELEARARNQMDYLKLAYEFVVSRWHAGRMDTLYHAPLAFRKNISTIWRQPGYAHCNTQNYLLYVLLVGSRFFNPQDITVKTVFFNFFIHQYLRVKIGEKWIDADPAGASIRKMPLGTHISFFG